MTKRYLVYKNWNGQIHTSIEYGEQYTGDGKKKDASEIKRIYIGFTTITDIKTLKIAFPLEEVKNESTINS
jgi:hypothetical protein